MVAHIMSAVAATIWRELGKWVNDESYSKLQFIFADELGYVYLKKIKRINLLSLVSWSKEL